MPVDMRMAKKDVMFVMSSSFGMVLFAHVVVVGLDQPQEKQIFEIKS
jgi:hypothetical protein